MTILMSLLISAQEIQSTQHASRVALDYFCKDDNEGKRLSPETLRPLTSLFVDARTLVDYSEVFVITNYSQREISVGADLARFSVDYRVLGYLNSSLHFTSLQQPYDSRPKDESVNVTLVLSDAYYEPSISGSWHKVRGLPGWKIKTAPIDPHVGIPAAIHYVETTALKSKDPLVKANAQTTLAELQKIYRFQNRPMQLGQPPSQTPEAILLHLISLETDGIGLTSDGTRQLDAFFQHPSPRAQGRIRVTKGYEVKSAKSSASSAELYVEYGAVGELDSMLRLTVAPRGKIAREDYHLILDDKYSLRSNPAKEFIGPSRWRIADAHPEQWISLGAAIRYVSEARDSTKDSAIRLNADKTLAVLARHR